MRSVNKWRNVVSERCAAVGTSRRWLIVALGASLVGGVAVLVATGHVNFTGFQPGPLAFLIDIGLAYLLLGLFTLRGGLPVASSTRTPLRTIVVVFPPLFGISSLLAYLDWFLTTPAPNALASATAIIVPQFLFALVVATVVLGYPAGLAAGSTERRVKIGALVLGIALVVGSALIASAVYDGRGFYALPQVYLVLSGGVSVAACPLFAVGRLGSDALLRPLRAGNPSSK